MSDSYPQDAVYPQHRAYRPGDVANGHVVTPAGVWQPFAAPAGNVATHIEQTVATRTADTERTAWLLWAFLGGVNAHLAYLYPKQRALILALSIVGLIVTVGISGLLWVVTWAFIKSGVENYRQHVRAEVEAEVLRHAAVSRLL